MEAEFYYNFRSEALLTGKRSKEIKEPYYIYAKIEVTDKFKYGGWWDEYIGIQHMAIIKTYKDEYTGVIKVKEAIVCILKGSYIITGRSIDANCFTIL